VQGPLIRRQPGMKLMLNAGFTRVPGPWPVVQFFFFGAFFIALGDEIPCCCLFLKRKRMNKLYKNYLNTMKSLKIF
jgi:hypothetical protein